MKTKMIILLIILGCLLMILPVGAHSGRTDSNGGHYDHSTGEYHYHHGYPAHQHYDMNGDGVKDCPYLYNGEYFDWEIILKLLFVIVLSPILWYLCWHFIFGILLSIFPKIENSKFVYVIISVLIAIFVLVFLLFLFEVF